MQTRSSSKFMSKSSSNPISTNSKHRNRRCSKPRVKPFSMPIVTMADDRTMEEMLQAPTEGGNSSSTDARIDKLTDTISNLVETFNMKMTTPATVKAVEETCVICGGAHPYYDCIATDSNIGSLPSNTVPNPREDLKAITTRSGVTLAGPSVSSPPSKKVYREPEMITDQVMDMSKSGQNEAKRTKPGTILNKKEKLFDLAITLVNENCPAVILKKLLEKLGKPGKFLISCDFPELDECLTLFDLGASINLMPLSIWRKLSLPELTYTQMILELADRSTTRPASIAEDVFIKVGKFHFLTDFVVVDYVVDPRVPLILWRPFLRTGRALIDVYELKDEEKSALLKVLKSHKRAIAWKISNIKGIDPCFCTHKILMEDDFKPAVQHQRRVNPKIHEVIKKEVIKLLDAGLIYSIFDSPYDGYSGCFQILIDPQDQEKTTFTYPYGTFAYRLLSKTIVYTDHSALKYLLAKQDAKPRLLQWILLLQEFDVIIRDKKGAENLAADHLSSLENPYQDELGKKEITKTFPLETLGENRASWFDKLDDALWAFRTTFKTPIRCTLYKLVYGKACHLPIALEHKAYWVLKHCNFDLKTESSKPDGPDRSPLPMFSLMGPLSYLKPMVLTLRIAPDLEASCARGFVHRLLELQSLAYGNPIS
nr:reverse transcriptase domain-containing protein [Tanacetum cinerariifolium]